MKACLFAVAVVMSGGMVLADTEGSDVAAAREVISHFAGTVDPQVELVLTTEAGPDRYSTQVVNDKLVVSGNSPLALTHGFYAATKAQKRGMNGWAGNRFAEGAWTSAAEVSGSTVFDYRYYLNVVTYGYSMPYWTWERWSQEIDYMALHGINAPITLVAQEAIMARVFKKLGLTDEEIQGYFVGPVHLPWMRMGNISGLDSPLPLEWHADQIALQHQILNRMRALKMKFICPGFAGFVPPALTRIYPDLQLVETSWSSGRFHNWMVMPNDPVFVEIGTKFIQEWQAEFGTCDLYLIDSFNEMETPFPAKGTAERYTLMNEYGEKVYESIHAANPNAIWVMQGWMFGYQRGVWDYETLAALMERVPDDKMLLLDEACDYNKHFWHNGWNWDLHRGYSNKPWIWGVIPNMGGKCGLTGVLDFYANGHLEALASANKGRLVGHGAAPEGIECNPVVFEVLADAAWRTEPVDIKEVLRDYSLSRYGACPPELEAFWDGMLKSCYGSFTDHARYNWQVAPGATGKGTINANKAYFTALEKFVEAATNNTALAASPLFRADLIDYTAMYVGGIVEKLVVASEAAMRDGDTALSDRCESQIEELMLGMDALLAAHPHLSMQRWIDFARAHGNGNETLANYYEKNARRIVTIWGPPVDDYACKIWSGLIRDYYLPRRKIYIDNRRGRSSVNRSQWELNWVEQTTGLSAVTAPADPVAAAASLLSSAKALGADIDSTGVNGSLVVGSWDSSSITMNWQEVRIPCSTADIRGGRMIRLRYTGGSQRLEIQEIAIELDGQRVAESTAFGWTGSTHQNNTLAYTISDPTLGNNSCEIVVKIRTQNNTDSAGVIEILPRKTLRPDLTVSWTAPNAGAMLNPVKISEEITDLGDVKRLVFGGKLGGESMGAQKLFTAVVFDSEDANSVTYQFQLNDYNHANDCHLKVSWVKFTIGDGGLYAQQIKKGYVWNKGPELVGTRIDTDQLPTSGVGRWGAMSGNNYAMMELFAAATPIASAVVREGVPEPIVRTVGRLADAFATNVRITALTNIVEATDATMADKTIVIDRGTVCVTNTFPGTIEVATGGVYDIAWTDGNRSLEAPTIVMAGGTLTNNGTSGVSYGSVGLSKMSFTEDSTIAGNWNLYSIAGGYNEFDYALNGHTLTKTGTGIYTIKTGRLVGGGAVDVQGGTLVLQAVRLAAEDVLTVAVEAGKTLRLTNGDGKTLDLAGTIHLARGSFTAPSAVTLTVTVPEDKELVTTTANNVTTYALADREETNDAEIDGTKYATVEEALLHLSNGKTLTLLRDVTLDHTLAVDGLVNGTIDLNGHAIVNTGAGDVVTIAQGAVVTITGEGTIVKNGADYAITSAGLTTISAAAGTPVIGGIVAAPSTASKVSFAADYHPAEPVKAKIDWTGCVSNAKTPVLSVHHTEEHPYTTVMTETFNPIQEIGGTMYEGEFSGGFVGDTERVLIFTYLYTVAEVTVDAAHVTIPYLFNTATDAETGKVYARLAKATPAGFIKGEQQFSFTPMPADISFQAIPDAGYRNPVVTANGTVVEPAATGYYHVTAAAGGVAIAVTAEAIPTTPTYAEVTAATPMEAVLPGLTETQKATLVAAGVTAKDVADWAIAKGGQPASALIGGEGAIDLEAFALGCAPAEKERVLEGFRVNFDERGRVVVEGAEGFNVAPILRHSVDLKSWGETGNFTKAVIEL